MKQLLPTLACVLYLAGCTSSPTATKEQEAISAYIKEHANDPDSYQSVRFGKAEPWRQHNADKLEADQLLEKVNRSLDYVNKSTEQTIRMIRLNASKEQLKPFEARYEENLAEYKQIRAKYDSLKYSTDTTRIGSVLIHAFRGKNKMGALVLDSAQFVVYKDGKVKPL